MNTNGVIGNFTKAVLGTGLAFGAAHNGDAQKPQGPQLVPQGIHAKKDPFSEAAPAPSRSSEIHHPSPEEVEALKVGPVESQELNVVYNQFGQPDYAATVSNQIDRVAQAYDIKLPPRGTGVPLGQVLSVLNNGVRARIEAKTGVTLGLPPVKPRSPWLAQAAGIAHAAGTPIPVEIKGIQGNIPGARLQVILNTVAETLNEVANKAANLSTAPLAPSLSLPSTDDHVGEWTTVPQK